MRSRVLLLGATIIALVASGATKAADLEPGVKLPPAVWDWSGGYIGGHVSGGYGRISFTDPYGQSIYGDADRFDVTPLHNPHLSFGQGPHFCLGAGAPRIAIRIPGAVRAAGGSGPDHRSGGRRLHAVLPH